MATVAGTQGCTRTEVPDPKIFNPTELNTDQWLESIVAFGAKYAVLVAKHNCGFCTWPTKVKFPEFGFSYDYSVNSSAYRGDIVSQFVASCKKYGVKPGFYYSVVTNSYLNVENGKVFGGKLVPGQVNVTQEQYDEIVLAQITELWTNNGPLLEIWFDGGYQQDIKEKLSALLLKLQPNAVAFNGYGVSVNPVRWIGTESGHAPYPTWSTGVSNGGDPNSTVWAPPECDMTMQRYDTWFYNAEVGIHTMAELLSIYHDSVGHNCNMLIDFAPQPNGLLPVDAVQRYKEFGDYIRNCYGKPLNSVSGTGATLILEFTSATTVNRVALQEDQSRGQRVRTYQVEGYVSDWVVLSSGSSIGNKKIDLFAHEITVTKLRFTAQSFVDTPIITLSAYNCATLL
eukprot:TRINITY_DN77_c0_g1_i2.p1 TRINITY_DN77_c0_g1~~TRINITY_DN77_c0_g1_i2.p1  ORF type:complete len:443 (+),score=77.55 TRINITY_DN77_c0_g1_i2:138-1331(+)